MYPISSPAFDCASKPEGWLRIYRTEESSKQFVTCFRLHLKEEARDFLELETLRDLIKKYSQFINFDIFLWASKTEEVEEPIVEDEAEKKPEDEKKDDDKKEDKKDDEEDAKVEEDKEEKEKKPTTKKVCLNIYLSIIHHK